MIRYKKTVSIAMSMVVMATLFSTNVFAGGFGGCCLPNSNPPSKGTGRYHVESACYHSDYCDNALVKTDGSTNQTGENNIPLPLNARERYQNQTGEDNIPLSFNAKEGELIVKFIGREKMCDFSSLRIPPWDSYKNQITSIKIENGVTKISNNAFAGCKYVTSITIPDSVTEIGNNAFRGCKSLKKVTIPDSVTKIGRQAFAECIGLSSITYLGNSDLDRLDRKDVFYDCPRLRKVNVKRSYTEDTFCGTDISKASYTENTFCGTDTSDIDTSKVSYTENTFCGTDTSDIDTSKIISK